MGWLFSLVKEVITMSEFKAKIIAELDTAKVEQELQNLQKNGGKVKVAASTKEAEKEFKSLNSEINKTAKSSETFGQKLKDALHIGSAAAVIAKGFQLISSAARQAINTIKELDNVATNLRMATGESYSNVSKLIQNYSKMGQSLGATTMEISDAANSWLRQGKTLEETNELIKASTILSKVGSIDSAAATEYLTSALNGYKLEASDALNVVSKLSAVDLSSASDAGGLAVSMSKTASAASMAGVEIDQLIGMIATVKEVTQASDEEVGNAFKSMFSRINQVKAGAEFDEYGESVNNVEKVLSNLGIELRNQENQWRNSGDVLTEVGSKWDALNDSQKRQLATALGGTYQYNKVISLMDNYSNALEYTEIATNSAGTAEEKFAAYLDSIESKSKSLQAAFESLVFNDVSSKILGNIIDITSQIVLLIDKTHILEGTLSGLAAAGAIKVFSVLAAGVSSSVIKLNELNSALQVVKAGNIGESEISTLAQLTSNLSDSQMKAVISSKQLTNQQRIAILTSQGLSESEAAAKLSTLGLASAENTATGATATLGGTLKGLWATLKANPLILIFSGVTAAVAAFNAYNDKVEETKQATIEAAQQSAEHIKELENALNSYLELDTDATEAEKATALKSVTDQLHNKTKALIDATEAEKGYIDAVEGSIQADYKEATGKAKNARVEIEESMINQWAPDYSTSFSNSDSSNKQAYELTKNILGDYLTTDGKNSYSFGIDKLINTTYKNNSEYAESFLKYYELLEQAQSKIQQESVELGEAGNSLLESEFFKNISNILSNETTKENIENYVDSFAEEIYSETIASRGIPETVEEFQKLKEIMLEDAGDSDRLAESITLRLNSAFSSLSNESVKVNDVLSGIDFNIDSEEISNELNNINSAFETVQKAVEEYNNNGVISYDTMMSLLSVDNEYLNVLINEQGQLDLTSEKFKELTKAKLEQLKTSLLQSALDEVNAINTQTAALAYLGEQQEKSAKSALELADARWKEAFASAAARDAEQNTGNLYQRVIMAAQSSWLTKVQIIDDYENSLNSLNSTTDTYKDKLESEKSALEDAKSALEEKKSALEDTKSGYEDAINSIKDLIDWTEKYIKQTKQDEIDALEEQKQKIDDLIDSKKELLQAEKDEYEWNKEISEKQNTVASDALSAAAASLDDSSAGQKSYKEASDTLSDSRSDLYDSLYTHEIDTRIEALDALKEQNDQYYEEQIESINEFLNDEVALHKAACSMIDNDNGTLYSKLLNYARTYTTTTDAEFNYMWSSAKSAMQNYNTANLDTFSLLNNLQSRIYEVDGAIDNIADSISSYEDKISGVQSKLDNLTNSAKTSIETINNLVDSLEPYWSVSHNGRMFYSYQESKDKAASDLANQLRAAGLSDTANSVWDKMKKYKSSYAKGTKSAKGGISRVDEEGLYSELIPYKVGEGRYTILPEGNPVFSKNMTDELYDFASNPSEYIKYLASNTTELMPDNDYYYKKYKDNIPLIDYSGLYKTNFDKEVREILNTTSNSVYHNEQIPSPTININIQGDATQSTVKALQLEADKIVDRATKNVMNIALKNKRII